MIVVFGEGETGYEWVDAVQGFRFRRQTPIMLRQLGFLCVNQ
jgi:hypothetical protein